jgi:hypothetical protein
VVSALIAPLSNPCSALYHLFSNAPCSSDRLVESTDALADGTEESVFI